MSRVLKILLVLWTAFVVVLGLVLAHRIGAEPDYDASAVSVAGTTVAISLFVLWCIGGVPLAILALVFRGARRRSPADAR